MSVIDGLIIDPNNVVASLLEHGYEIINPEFDVKQVKYKGNVIYEVEPNGLVRHNMIAWNCTDHPTLLEIIRVHGVSGIETGVITFLDTGTISGGNV